MSEYEQYNINEIVDMIKTDDPDATDDLAQAWSNKAYALGELHEALEERLATIKDKWTSAASKPFITLAQNTVKIVGGAKEQAEAKAEGLGQAAATARWAQDRVGTQYKEYLQASLKNTGDQIADASDPLSGVRKAAENPWGTITGSNDTPTESEIRKPFDEKARKYMQVASETYQTQRPKVEAPVPKFTPIKDPGDQWSDGEDSWEGDGGSGSNTSDMTGLSAVSHGGNALGAHPELQSGATHAPATPSHSGPVGPGVPSGPSTGVPVGGVPPMGGGKPPTAPPRLPNGPMSNARNTLTPRGTTTARTTPGLPGRGTGGVNGRSGPMNGGQGRNAGRGGAGAPNGARNRYAGRGLQKSRMEPVNRVGQPRKAGEVMGSRGAKTSKAGADAGKTPARRVQPTVVRGAKNAAKNSRGRKSPIDNTKRGYSSRVLNPRNRISEANGHSRTPLVGKKLDTTAKPVPIGKRPEPETARSKIRAEIDAFRAERRQRQERSDGLSRPVIDNGVANTGDLDQAIPTPREAVKAQDVLWQPRTDIVPGVIGKRHWNPDAVDHDPGPVANAWLQARQAFEAELDARVAAIDPGPTAFDPKRQRPDTSTWPGTL